MFDKETTPTVVDEINLGTSKNSRLVPQVGVIPAVIVDDATPV